MTDSFNPSCFEDASSLEERAACPTLQPPTFPTTHGEPIPVIMIRRPDHEVDGPTRFLPGDLVQHRRYGYRGVVVDVDLTCQASSDWYNNNQTQPDQDKPWYHVLVDGSTHSTYAAEGNLEPDSSLEPINHPLLGVFFESFSGDCYKRNYRPWSL